MWGTNAKDGAPPVRVEDAHPAIVSKREFRRARKLLVSRAPKSVHPRRVGSSYLLSGLLRCKTCNRALSGQDSKSGVKLLDEEMDGVAHEQRERLQTIESELADVRRRLDRLYNLVEITDFDMADVTPRIRDHRERQERLEAVAGERRPYSRSAG